MLHSLCRQLYDCNSLFYTNIASGVLSKALVAKILLGAPQTFLQSTLAFFPAGWMLTSFHCPSSDYLWYMCKYHSAFSLGYISGIVGNENTFKKNETHPVLGYDIVICWHDWLASSSCSVHLGAVLSTLNFALFIWELHFDNALSPMLSLLFTLW